jgi:acetyl esterase/lipase
VTISLFTDYNFVMTDPFPEIHPELQQAAKMSPKLSFNKRSSWFINLLMRFMSSPKDLEGIFIENIHISGQDERTQVRLRIYKPENTSAPRPVLLWMHGGGYVIGRPEQDDASCVQYVRDLGITVVSVDYRCGPKHPFPAGLDDCSAALKWVSSHTQDLNIDPERIAVGGNSAGSGLATALDQLAHDRNETKIAFQLLIYPMLDDRTVLRTDIDDSSNITWHHNDNRFGWESYLGMECGADDVPAYSVPARRADLSGLPPAWIGVGDLDIFHDEDVAYAQRLRECGVECELEVVEGAFHGFDVFDLKIPLVQDFRKSQTAAMRKYLFQ